ncbi:hypothetical protein [Helicobacter pylori]|uniref:hypothetical protein n=1 Tax=Helicobacter pylori TaxID=210 RepID=UPI002AC38234|nr:hypothetical protein [Helicobacter pylori]MDZ5288569.1 hypothetical protein [Helicobacter pylori]
MAWDLSHITKQVEAQAVEHLKDIATDMANSIASRAPVDTSRLVSNNYISQVTPDESFDENFFLGRAGARNFMFMQVQNIKTLQNVYFRNLTPYGVTQDVRTGFYRMTVPAIARKYGY